MNRTEVADNIFKSIDVIVDKKIRELSFDRSVIMQIKERSDKANCYKVDYLGVELIAYPIDRTIEYNRGEAVWVLVPQGDFSKEKFILGPIEKNWREMEMKGE